MVDDGIQHRSGRNERAGEPLTGQGAGWEQHAGEQRIPEFTINQLGEDDIRECVQCSQSGTSQKMLVKWELFVLYAKVDELTKMVTEDWRRRERNR